ncbi:hypothetical protein CHS0354_015004 [Potamilus streckersoni]|uniref:Tetraspanin n=1 Tax=Potamilus streckersoni TaxID=2493646 RepID=A0AAE0VXU4_9BIVA|nr:hypothetical protein CHS0354_015004 [Potamilus streckersoni]
MGCIQGLGKVIIVIINIFFILLGFIFSAIGIFLFVGKDFIKQYLDVVKKALEEAASSTGQGSVTIDLDQIFTIFQSLAAAFLCFGIFMLVISFLGCCGACCKFKVALIIYAIILAAILLGLVIVGAIFFANPAIYSAPLKRELKQGIQNEYKGLAGTNLVSMAWNVVMQNFKCCGVDSYSDFTGAKQWNDSIPLVSPFACCKTLPKGSSSSDTACGTSPNTYISYYDIGCFGKIWEIVFGNTAIFVGTFAGLLSFMLILIILSIVLICDSKSNKVSP